jgi:ABC-type Fe3+-hydroxamate transport system substrate-binding protein
VKAAQNIGGTKQVDFERVARLSPDLLIAEKEENTREMVAALERNYPVYVANVTSVASALKLIRNLGDLTGRTEQAAALADAAEAKFRSVSSAIARSMAYLIWQKPFMAVGANTYLDDLLMRFGFTNVFAGATERYPEISLAELQRLRPEVVFLSSEPFPFGQRHQATLQAELPDSRVVLVDGEISWYGSRMEWAVPYLGQVVATLAAV